MTIGSLFAGIGGLELEHVTEGLRGVCDAIDFLLADL